MEDKEVVWKCRRGTKELDLMMNGFYENYYKNASKSQKQAFVKLLSLEDPFISDLLMNKTIAIQGAEGSNHHKVARDFYGTSIVLKECMSFDALVDSLLDASAKVGVMALENTIAGSIIPNYALIDSNNLHIIGEEYLIFITTSCV